MDRFYIINMETGNFSLVANVFDEKIKKSQVLATIPGPAHDQGKEQFLVIEKWEIWNGGDFVWRNNQENRTLEKLDRDVTFPWQI